MKELWTRNWKKALIWLCGYVHLIAFVIAGGYVITKTADKQLHKTAKLVFIVTLVFTVIEALIAILSGIASLGANMGTAINWINFFVLLAKIGVFAAGIIMSLFESAPSEEGKARGTEPVKAVKAEAESAEEKQAQTEEAPAEETQE